MELIIAKTERNDTEKTAVSVGAYPTYPHLLIGVLSALVFIRPYNYSNIKNVALGGSLL